MGDSIGVGVGGIEGGGLIGGRREGRLREESEKR